jgi:hypothetical protein
LFDVGNTFPFRLQLDTVTAYAAWQPVRVNAGGGYFNPQVTGFFINETGLQWTASPEQPGSDLDYFGGWLGESCAYLTNCISNDGMNADCD